MEEQENVLDLKGALAEPRVTFFVEFFGNSSLKLAALIVVGLAGGLVFGLCRF